MGNLVSRIQGFCGRKTKPQTSIAFIGLDAAGKTTMLYRLKLNMTVNVIPTIGFNKEILDIGDDLSLFVLDVSIGSKGRPLLRHYLDVCEGFVFVVDSKDTQSELLYRQDIKIPFVVLANKQDLEGACQPSDVASHLDLEKIPSKRWDVFGSIGLTGEGVKEALEKLCTMIKENRSQ